MAPNPHSDYPRNPCCDVDSTPTPRESNPVESKHLQIDSKLKDLENAVETLERFLERVRGQDLVTVPSQVAGLPLVCLSEFLAESSGRIDKYVVRLHEVHNGLREVLF